MLITTAKKVVLTADGDSLMVQNEDGKLYKSNSFLTAAYRFMQDNLHLTWGEAEAELREMFHDEFGAIPIHPSVWNGLARIYVEVHNAPSWNAWHLDEEDEDPLDEEELKQLHRDFWAL